MDYEQLALLTREEIEKEIYSRYPDPTDDPHGFLYDIVLENRFHLREIISRLQIGALLDGKLSIDQVVEQNHSPYDDPELDTDGIHRSVLEQALQDQQEGVKSREKIIEETDYYLSLL